MSNPHPTKPKPNHPWKKSANLPKRDKADVAYWDLRSERRKKLNIKKTKG